MSCIQVLDEGRRHSARRSRACLRQVLPGRRRRSPARGHRPRPCDLPRLRRGYGWQDHRQQPHRSPGRRRSPSRCLSRSMRSGQRRRLNDHRLRAARVLVVDDEPAILRFLRAGSRRPGLSSSSRPTNGADGARGNAPAQGRPDRARPRIAGHRRPRGHPAHARQRFRRCRSSYCPVATTRPRRSRRWTSAPMTTSRSRSASTNCWRECGLPNVIDCSSKARSRSSAAGDLDRRPGPPHRHGARRGGEILTARV